MQTTPVASTAAVTARAKPRSAPLDPQTADRLLDLLSTDDGFRRLFKRSPEKALEQLGFDPSPGSSPAFCFSVTRLASKAQIAACRATLTAMLTQGLAYTPPMLEARVARGHQVRK